MTSTIQKDSARSVPKKGCGIMKVPARRPMPSCHPLRGSARKHELYSMYSGMFLRCYNPKSTSYRSYGARGISVCDRWSTGQAGAMGFWNFVDDMGDRPCGYTIERRDFNSGYCPENCYWLPREEQNKPGRRRVRVDYTGIQGEKHGMSKLTDAQRAQIKKARLEGEPVRAIAERYSVSRSQVYRILGSS